MYRNSRQVEPVELVLHLDVEGWKEGGESLDSTTKQLEVNTASRELGRRSC